MADDVPLARSCDKQFPSALQKDTPYTILVAQRLSAALGIFLVEYSTITS
jgi:hypothetical protein